MSIAVEIRHIKTYFRLHFFNVFHGMKRLFEGAGKEGKNKAKMCID